MREAKPSYTDLVYQVVYDANELLPFAEDVNKTWVHEWQPYK